MYPQAECATIWSEMILFILELRPTQPLSSVSYGLFEGDWIMDAAYKWAIPVGVVRLKTIGLVYAGLEMNKFL